MVLKKISSFYKDYERHISSISLIGGFVFDILTLHRADTFWENFWIIVHLLVAAIAIILLNRASRTERGEDSEFDFWMVNVLQFCFGGLLSAFFTLYFRSATLSVSWPFLLLLLLAFIGNERFKRQYQRLVFQTSFFFLNLLLFSIFLVPVVIGVIGPVVFVGSALVSLIIFYIFFRILKSVGKGRVQKSNKSIGALIFCIFVLLNVLYFANVIPPIPLSLRQGGIYYSVDRNPDGNYVLRKEVKSWLDYFKTYPPIDVEANQPLYAYTAIFSPGKFSIPIIHEWQYDDPNKGWVTESRIPLQTKGGRELGYRTFSYSLVTAGKWRVNVLTEQGQILGRINFQVEITNTTPELVTEIN